MADFDGAVFGIFTNSDHDELSKLSFVVEGILKSVFFIVSARSVLFDATTFVPEKT